MVIARVELPCRKEAPPQVCEEPDQLPNEGVLAARGLSLVLPPADLSDERQMTSHVTLKAQLTNNCRRGLVHVMLANFSQEEIVLPKATVVGVAEAVSLCVVAEINDSASPRNTPCFTNGKRVNYSIWLNLKLRC